MRTLANICMRLALQLLPAQRQNWGRAMFGDFHHLTDDRKAILWAAGCVLASLKMQVLDVITGTLKVSRWLLGVEMIFCFGWLTFAWLDAIVSASFGFAWLSSRSIIELGASAAGGGPLVWLACALLFGALGPIGLVLALQSIYLRMPLPRRLAAVLIGMPLMLGAVWIGSLFIGMPRGSAAAMLPWRELFLLWILPALATMHLLWWSRPQPALLHAA